ncbi:unnamed protein product [Microthlaspi erraticum]|uniref:F-box domain-containing protein n=1 Tax=Microthlaspi erraticum TaxID=1685480 RepID=A0A6D2J1G5_9BRAS|nr:unnamed protein product [Microthlaspi erraticum]
MDSLSPSSDGPSWSKLHTDLLHMVFERLGFADFQRAKSVCSSWHSASRQSAPTNQIPWLILFPEKGKDQCLLFNPEEKDKIYRIQDLDVNFANSHCLAISGSWLFIRDPSYNFYILNLFTRERIHLPSVESQLGMLKIEQTTNDMFIAKLTDEDDRRDVNFYWPRFWIEEKTREYVVTLLIDFGGISFLIYSKKGDSFWKQIKLTKPYDVHLADVVCKDHKIYLYNWSRNVKVLDLSGDSPRQILETQGNYVWFFKMPQRVFPHLGDVWPIKKKHFVVTVTGEFLRVKSIVMSNSDVWTFCVYKMDSSNREWEKITSLGDEVILLDQGITVLANAIEGLNRNSIYFNGDPDAIGYRVWSEKDVLIYNIDTQEVERPHRSICSSIQSSYARWFVPNFSRK